MTDELELSIVVPTYNERDRLEELVAVLAGVCAGHGIAGEIVIVDDNSPDGTGAIADSLASRYPVQVVHRAGKMGLGSAVIEGFAVARGRMLGVMDADLSHPPSVLPGMVAVLRSLDVDVVVGSRYIPGGGVNNWPFFRRAMSRVACLLAWPLTPVRDATSGLFLVRRTAIQGVAISAAGFKICLELLMRSRIGSVAELPYVFSDRAMGESKMTTREALGYFVQLRDLLVFRFLKDRKPRARYQRLSAAELASLTASQFGRAPAPTAR